MRIWRGTGRGLGRAHSQGWGHSGAGRLGVGGTVGLNWGDLGITRAGARGLGGVGITPSQKGWH